MKSIQSIRETELTQSYAFNPGTREVETRVMAGWREEYKVGGDRRSVQSEGELQSEDRIALSV